LTLSEVWPDCAPDWRSGSGDWRPALGADIVMGGGYVSCFGGWNGMLVDERLVVWK
jgi:hypothetical protein